MIFHPITSDFLAWYATDFVLAILIAIGFYASIAGEPLFRAARFDD